MQNKILITIVILLNLIIFSAKSEDQINFDVTEIEILDGGNKIIGKNRGIITTNDGITIEADEFEFDKIKNVLNAKGNIKIKDQLNDFKLSAQNILYNKDIERIDIKGNIEALINSDYKFQTNNITLLRNEMIISSDLGGTILDNINQNRYEIGKFTYSFKDKVLKGEKIFLNTKYNQPFSDKYFFKSAVFNLENQNYIAQDIDINLKKDIFGNKNNDPRFKGLSSSSKDGVTIINKGIFTSCKKKR